MCRTILSQNRTAIIVQKERIQKEADNKRRIEVYFAMASS